MVPHPPISSSSFRLIAKGLIELHRLIMAGKVDSPEAESVRDALDAPLKALSRSEKERAQWLSEDLYSVSEAPAATSQKEINSQALQQLNEAIEAKQRGEWDQALKLLRQARENLPPDLLSYLRGSCWQEAGHPDVATVFYEHASESAPANAAYRTAYLHALAKSNPNAAGKLAGQVLANDEKHAPVAIAQAADIRFNEIRTASDADSARMYRELIQVLEKNVKRIEKDEGSASSASAYAMTVGLLGLCHEFLGNTGTAVNYYSRGLQVKPTNDGLLVVRGILQYGTSPRAISDFEQAVSLHSLVIWPHLFLAHHYLATSRFEQCRLMCEIRTDYARAGCCEESARRMASDRPSRTRFPAGFREGGF